MSNPLWEFLSAKKGYVIHALAVAIFFLGPSVEAYASTHLKTSAAILLVWGWILHWAKGR